VDVLGFDYRVVFSADDHLGDGSGSKGSAILGSGMVKTEDMVEDGADTPCHRSRTSGHEGDVGRLGGSSVWK